ncbi:MAG: M13 family peptidase [Flavobacterium sp.]|nr:M13 family peptidase [Candidatus Neoflavobacterium equi]
MNKKIVAASIIATMILFSCGKETEDDGKVHGIHLEYMDKTVKPGDDFFKYVNGAWFEKTEIPADKSSWGSFDELAQNTDLDVLSILKEAASNKDIKEGSDESKAINLYKTYLDTITRNKLGVHPIQKDLDLIDALKNTADLNALMQSTILDGGVGFISMFVGADAMDSNKNVVYIYPGSIGMPDRDYYVSNDADSKEKLDLYEKHIVRMLGYINYNEADAKVAAAKIVALEKKLAAPRFTRVESRDDRLTYNPMTVAALQGASKQIQWDALFKAAGMTDLKNVVIAQPKYMAALNGVINDASIEDVKLYLKWTLLNDAAGSLTTAMDNANFEFYNKTLSGATAQRPMEERALNIVNGSIGEALGKLYVEKRFPAEAKQKAQEMIANVIKAYENRINKLQWMAPATKKGAIEKLHKLSIKIGYPDKWEDFSKLTVSAPEKGNYYENMERINRWEIAKNIADLNKPVDKSKWGMPPQMVNAYFNPAYNEIVFPAAILQPPFYDYKADEAVNYGGIGAVIGHEISHGFDDSGARYNAEGNLVDWWTTSDLSQFTTLGKALAKQYSALQPFSGIYVDGDFTLGENIGDLGGITAAYEGLQMFYKENGKPEPIDGFTADQRFFISWATIWRTKSRDEYVKRQVKTDPHAPGIYRSYVPLQNIDAWYEAFGIKEGDKLFIKPEDRVKIW